MDLAVAWMRGDDEINDGSGFQTEKTLWRLTDVSDSRTHWTVLILFYIRSSNEIVFKMKKIK